MIDRLFVYGTLRDEKLMNAVVGYVPYRQSAALWNYKTKHSGLYAILPSPGEVVVGAIWGLENPEEDLKKLDVYECTASGLYSRESIYVNDGQLSWIYMPSEEVIERVFGK